MRPDEPDCEPLYVDAPAPSHRVRGRVAAHAPQGARPLTPAEEIDAAMNAIDAACLAGDFGTAKAAILATRDGPIAVGLAALIIARAWSSTLWKERSAVAASIRERSPDRAADLLRGLIE